MVDVKGRHALKVNEGEGMGVIWLDGYDFANGVIEVDMLGRSQPLQSRFVGGAFRVVIQMVADVGSLTEGTTVREALYRSS